MASASTDAGLLARGIPTKRTIAELEALLAERERENARLRADLQERGGTTAAVPDRQSAVTDILTAISRSPGDIQAVADAIVEHAVRLCAGTGAVLRLRRARGLELHAETMPGDVRPRPIEEVRSRLARQGLPPTSTYISPKWMSDTPAGRCVETGQVVEVPDHAAMGALGYPEKICSWFVQYLGPGSSVFVPLIGGDGEAVGSLRVNRAAVGSFPAEQIATLRTFAAEAVVGIESARLVAELREALERQTATSEVLATISRSPADLMAVFNRIATSAARLSGSDDAVLHLTRPDGSFDVVAHQGVVPTAPNGARMGLGGGTVMEQAIRERRTVEVPDVLELPTDEFPKARARAEAEGWRALLIVPMLHGDAVLGTISIRRAAPGPFAPEHLRLLETFADQAVIAVENSRLFSELQGRNAELAAALDEQRATGEVLQVIAESPTDLRRVIETIARIAKQMFAARMVAIHMRVGDAAGSLGSEPGVWPALRPLVRGWVAARAILDARTIRVDDVLAATDEFPVTYANATTGPIGFRSIVSTPMLRGGEAIGSLNVARAEARPFTDREVTLVETFANQAAIAIENAHLFQELNESNASLKETLAQQTATAQVLEVISRSPTDLQTVLDTIVDNAERLCTTEGASIILVLDGQVRGGAGVRPSSAPEDRLRRTLANPGPPRPFDRYWDIGCRAIVDAAIVQVEDIRALPDHEHKGDRSGLSHSILCVPLLREGAAIGAIVLPRYRVQTFTDAEIALVKTFADQAVIAIENSRLFAELQERLAEQVATGRVLRTIAESPTDPQRVLDVLVDTAAGLCRADRATIVLAEGDQVRMVAASGVGGVRRTLTHPGVPRAAPDPMDPRQLAVPLLLEDETVGYLVLSSAEPRVFEERVVALARTLADQAVIAIENARLYGAAPSHTAAPAITTPRRSPLTAREQEVAALVAEGRTNRQIAEVLVIAEPTAERHVANILGKLGFHARSQIAAWHERQAGAGGVAADQSPT